MANIRGFSKVETMVEDSFESLIDNVFSAETSGILAGITRPTVGRAYDSTGKMTLPHVMIYCDKIMPGSPDPREKVYQVSVKVIIRSSIRKDTDKNDINTYSGFIRWLLFDGLLIQYLNHQLDSSADNDLVFSSDTDTYTDLQFLSRVPDTDSSSLKVKSGYYEITHKEDFLVGEGTDLRIALTPRTGFIKVENMVEDTLVDFLSNSFSAEKVSAGDIFYGKITPTIIKGYASTATMTLPHISVLCTEISRAIDLKPPALPVAAFRSTFEIVIRTSIRDDTDKNEINLYSSFVRYLLAADSLATELNATNPNNELLYVSKTIPGLGSTTDDLEFRRVRLPSPQGDSREVTTLAVNDKYYEIIHRSDCLIGYW